MCVRAGGCAGAAAATCAAVAWSAAGPSPGESNRRSIPNSCSMTERTFDSEASQRGTHVRSRESHTEPLCGPLVPRGTDLPPTAPRPSEWLCGRLRGNQPRLPHSGGDEVGFPESGEPPLLRNHWPLMGLRGPDGPKQTAVEPSCGPPSTRVGGLWPKGGGGSQNGCVAVSEETGLTGSPEQGVSPPLSRTPVRHWCLPRS